MIGCYIKRAVLQGASRRTQLKPVAVPNNAVPNRGLISNWFDIRNTAVPCGISSNNAQQSPADRSFSWLSHLKNSWAKYSWALFVCVRLKLGAHRQIVLSCIWLSHIPFTTKLLQPWITLSRCVRVSGDFGLSSFL